jgi:hypothetical protein
MLLHCTSERRQLVALCGTAIKSLCFVSYAVAVMPAVVETC